MSETNAPLAASASPPETWSPSLGERIRWIWDLWAGHRGFLPVLIGLTLVSSGVAIAYPLVFRHIIDALAASSENPPIERALWILLAIAGGRFVAGFYPAFRAWVNLRIDVSVRRRVFESVQDKDHRFFNRFRTGDLATRLMDDIAEYPKLAWFSCSGVFRALESLSKLVFCVIAMFWLSAKLSFLAILPLPIMLWVIYRLRTRLRRAYEAQQRAISDTNDSLEAAFTGIRILKAFTAEPGQSQRFGEILDHRIDVQFRVKRLFALIQILDRVAGRFGQLMVISFGGVLIVRGELSLGTLYALYIYLDMLVEPMVDLPNLFVTSRQAFVCMDREEEVLRFPSEARAREESQVAETRANAEHRATGTDGAGLRGRDDHVESASDTNLESISLDNVGIEYDSGRPVLSGLDLEFRSGEKVAVIGEVGAGKSTLLHLLAGLIRPTTGQIRVNGHNFDSISWPKYRDQLGFVPQQSLLFSESIAQNIELGRDGELSLDEVFETVGMRSEVEAMAGGAQTTLGQKGTRVSGGQRQRLSIARALYTRPRLLLLDDCTASLDAANEDRLWESIDQWIPEAIVVLVSHRLATIRRADRLVLLDGGRVSDVGTHSELEERSELYREYLDRRE